MDRVLQWPASESNREIPEKERKRMEDGFSSYSSLYDTSSLLQFCNGKLIMCCVFSLRTDESIMIQVNMLPLDGGTFGAALNLYDLLQSLNFEKVFHSSWL